MSDDERSIGQMLDEMELRPTAKGHAVVEYDRQLAELGIPSLIRSHLTLAFIDGWDAAEKGET